MQGGLRPARDSVTDLIRRIHTRAYASGMSLLIAAQITAIATAILAVGAIVTAVLAYRALIKETEEVRAIERQVTGQQDFARRQSEVLELQARELDESLAERKWEAEQRRIAQASRIFTGAAPFSEDTADVSPRVVNASDLPVYDTQLWHCVHSDPDYDDLGTILPGEAIVGAGRYPAGTNPAKMNVILKFRDAAGVTWIRTQEGALIEQSGDTVADTIWAMFGPSAEDRQDP